MITEVILLCDRQDIALCGHDESHISENPGSFNAIIQLIANHDDQFKESYKNAPRNSLYTLPDIQNQLASIMSSMVREVICSQVRDAFIFNSSLTKQKTSARKSRCQLSYVTWRMAEYMDVLLVLFTLVALMQHP